jgi:uncharacterized protein YkwD
MSLASLALSVGNTARTALSALLITGLAGAAVLAGGTAPAAATTSVEQAFINDLNQARLAHGHPALVVRADLEQVARGQAARMAHSDTLYHNPNLTTEVTNWRWVGENVGYGSDEPTVHAAFMASPPHRANILDTDYTELGIGVVTAAGRVWVAEVFRQPMTTTAHPAHTKPTPPPARYTHRLSRGSNGPAVRRIQARLRIHTTGHYGHHTTTRVRTYQRHHGLHPTGSVGRATWNRLF